MKRIDLLIELLRAIYTLLKEYTEAHSETAAPQEELEEWLDKEAVMCYLRIKASTYYRWVRQGKLKPRGTDGGHRYFKDDLQEIFERRQMRQRG